jgi:hypothetical protein
MYKLSVSNSGIWLMTSQMYFDIQTIKSDPLIAVEYSHGNPFDHIIDIMSQGAIIIRFKYFSETSSSFLLKKK